MPGWCVPTVRTADEAVVVFNAALAGEDRDRKRKYTMCMGKKLFEMLAPSFTSRTGCTLQHPSWDPSWTTPPSGMKLDQVHITADPNGGTLALVGCKWKRKPTKEETKANNDKYVTPYYNVGGEKHDHRKEVEKKRNVGRKKRRRDEFDERCEAALAFQQDLSDLVAPVSMTAANIFSGMSGHWMVHYTRLHYCTHTDLSLLLAPGPKARVHGNILQSGFLFPGNDDMVWAWRLFLENGLVDTFPTVFLGKPDDRHWTQKQVGNKQVASHHKDVSPGEGLVGCLIAPANAAKADFKVYAQGCVVACKGGTSRPYHVARGPARVSFFFRLNVEGEVEGPLYTREGFAAATGVALDQ